MIQYIWRINMELFLLNMLMAKLSGTKKKVIFNNQGFFIMDLGKGHMDII